jgi:hypothetical protein
VREAIELSEAAGGRVPPPGAGTPLPGDRVKRESLAATRMLAAEPPQTRSSPIRLRTILAIVAAGVLGLHGWSL